MKNSLKIVVLLVVTAQLIAGSKKHYGGVAEAITVSNTQTVSNKEMLELSFKYGYMMHRYLGIEARGSFQLAQNKKIAHTFSYGLFLKPNYEIDTNTNIYGLVGYAKSKLVKNEKDFTNNETIQYDFSYGAGIEHKYADNKYVYIDFIRYIDKSTVRAEGKYAIKIDSIGIGLKYNFSF